jgi:hypothetical protein
LLLQVAKYSDVSFDNVVAGAWAARPGPTTVRLSGDRSAVVVTLRCTVTRA